MAQRIYIISYDITDDRRRRKIYEILRGWGEHLQYSVFRLTVSERDIRIVHAELESVLNPRHDQILLFDLGRTDGRALEAVISIGVGYEHPERHVFIV